MPGVTIREIRADLGFGAIIEGVNVVNLSDSVWDIIYSTFLDRGLVILPSQGNLTKEQQQTFAERWGELELPSIPISNEMRRGLCKEDDYVFQILKGNEDWHTDSTYMPLSSKCALLYAQQIPSKGGETAFADMRAAYADLDEHQKERIEDLAAYHSTEYSQAAMGHLSFSGAGGYGDHGNAYLRKLVKIHPETKRKALVIGRHAFGIPGLSEEESAMLLQDLQDFAVQPQRVYKHQWAVNDLIIWDNRCMLHRACEYDPSEARVLRGNRVAGEPATEASLPAPNNRKVLAKALGQIRKQQLQSAGAERTKIHLTSSRSRL